MSNLLETFEKFLADNSAWSMYITGQAGTGKTTALKELVDHSMFNDLNTVVCAFTHKACGILREKLNPGVNIDTLHAMLRKRPTINDNATKVKHIEISLQHNSPDKYDVIFIDEFSMVGEQDLMDLMAAIEDDETGEILTKVIFIGDRNQVPPVGDMQTITPQPPYHVHLTHIWRQAKGNPLIDVLCKLVDYIEDKQMPAPLDANSHFIRGVNLAEKYKQQDDPILLAYTNERVEYFNALIKGREYPELNDELFSPTTRKHYRLLDKNFSPSYINEIKLSFGDRLLSWDSKYKTLEHLVTMPNIQFFHLEDLDNEKSIHAVVFGHYQYKLYLEELKQEAAASNKACEEEAKQGTAREWAMANYHHPLSKRRRKAWRDYLVFKECVICLDFPYAMTVHKSQGSTYKTVLIDTQDLYKCSYRDFKLYLRLMYVAISRASDKVYTN